MTYKLVTREVDVEEIYKAIEQDGFEWIRSEWIRTDSDGKVIAACVLGGGAVNLNVAATGDEINIPLPERLKELYAWGYENADDDDAMFLDEYADFIDNNGIGNGDEEGNQYTLFQQLDKLPVSPSSKWYRVDDNGAASTIIYWNDLYDPEKLGQYFIKTYAEITRLCYDILSPHFGTKLNIAVKDQPEFHL